MLLLGACVGGSGDASQDDVRDDVEDHLVEDGYIASPGAAPVELTATQAAAAASCVSTGLVTPDDFTPDERNDVANSGDGTPPDPELTARFQALVDGCVSDALEVGPSAPTGED